MSQQNQQASTPSSHEQATWSDLYQQPEDLEVARIVIEMMNADQNLLSQHPALYLRATRTLRRHEARVRRWKALGQILRVSGRLALAFLKRVASTVSADYNALIDANMQPGARPDLQEILKDPVLAKALDEFFQQRKNETAAEEKGVKAAGLSALRS